MTCNGLLGRRHKKANREKRKRKDLEMRALVMDGVLVVTDRTSPATHVGLRRHGNDLSYGRVSKRNIGPI